MCVRAAREEVKRLEIPFFVFHGDHDMIALKKSSEYLYKNAKTDVLYRKIHIFPNAKHEVMREKEPLASNCMQMIVDYLEERFNSPIISGDVVMSSVGGKGRRKYESWRVAIDCGSFS